MRIWIESDFDGVEAFHVENIQISRDKSSVKKEKHRDPSLKEGDCGVSLFKSFHSADQIVEWLEKILIFYRHFPEKGQMHAWRFHTSAINCYASTPARVFLKRAAIISPDIPSDIALLDRFLDKTLHDSSSISRFCDASSNQGLFFVPEGRDIVRHLTQRTAQ